MHSSALFGSPLPLRHIFLLSISCFVFKYVRIKTFRKYLPSRSENPSGAFLTSLAGQHSEEIVEEYNIKVLSLFSKCSKGSKSSLTRQEGLTRNLCGREEEHKSCLRNHLKRRLMQKVGKIYLLREMSPIFASSCSQTESSSAVGRSDSKTWNCGKQMLPFQNRTQ